ncbi:MAG: radical SAM family heme chaperone HemW [Deltaproteobacteria bacterium]|nr:radical SAM family heme chaperone HemW [Deltaproteobacteria bacterium]
MSPPARDPPAEPADQPHDVAVYVHFPYCLQKCPYCDFNSYAPRTREPYAPYTTAVLRELDARLPEIAGGRLRSIFFGGGTPSLWEPSAIAAVRERIERAFPDRDAAIEVTLEANPGAVERGKLADFKAAGITRVSMGVQALDDRLLKALGRVHDAEEALDALAIIQATGFQSHSIDLIYGIPGQRGIPGQTPSEWQRTLDHVVSLATPHVSAYNLIYEPGTALYTWRQRGAVTPVDERDEVAMFDAACETFSAHGYAQYEVSNYARHGHRSIHNQLYWRARSYLGVGAGAHSAVREGKVRVRKESARDPHRYIAAWSDAQTSLALAPEPFSMQERVTASAEADEHVMLALRTTDGWDARTTERELRVPALRTAAAIAKTHADWCRFDGARLTPTRLGLKMNDSLILATVQLLDTLANGHDPTLGHSFPVENNAHGGHGFQ